MNKKRKHTRRFIYAWLMLTSIIAPTILEPVCNLTTIVYADPSEESSSADSSSESSSDKKNDDRSDDKSDDDSDSGAQTADASAKNILKRLNQKNNLYNADYPAGTRNAILDKSLPYSKSAQLIFTFAALKGDDAYKTAFEGDGESVLSTWNNLKNGVNLDFKIGSKNITSDFGKSDTANDATAANKTETSAPAEKNGADTTQEDKLANSSLVKKIAKSIADSTYQASVGNKNNKAIALDGRALHGGSPQAYMKKSYINPLTWGGWRHDGKNAKTNLYATQRADGNSGFGDLKNADSPSKSIQSSTSAPGDYTKQIQSAVAKYLLAHTDDLKSDKSIQKLVDNISYASLYEQQHAPLNNGSGFKGVASSYIHDAQNGAMGIGMGDGNSGDENKSDSIASDVMAHINPASVIGQSVSGSSYFASVKNRVYKSSGINVSSNDADELKKIAMNVDKQTDEDSDSAKNIKLMGWIPLYPTADKDKTDEKKSKDYFIENHFFKDATKNNIDGVAWLNKSLLTADNVMKGNFLGIGSLKTGLSFVSNNYSEKSKPIPVNQDWYKYWFGNRGFLSANNIPGSGTQVMGMDTLGNIIDGESSQIIIPYWQAAPELGLSKGTDSRSFAPIPGQKLNANAQKGAGGSSFDPLGKTSNSAISSVLGGSKTQLYKQTVALRDRIQNEKDPSPSKFISLANQTNGDNTAKAGQYSDAGAAAMAALITAHYNNKGANQEVLAGGKDATQLYVGHSDAKKKATKHKKGSNLFTAVDIIQYIGLRVFNGSFDDLRKTMSAAVANNYNTTIVENKNGAFFTGNQFVGSEWMLNMGAAPYVIIAIIVIAILVVAAIRYTFYTEKLTEGIRRLIILAIIIACTSLMPLLQNAFFNKPTQWISQKPIMQQALVDQYSRLRQQEALDNVFYSSLFGDKFGGVNKSTDYMMKFYTATQTNGQINKDELVNANPDKVFSNFEIGVNKFLGINRNGTTKLTLTTSNKSTQVSMMDVMSWASHMTRQKYSAEGKTGYDPSSGLYEEANNVVESGSQDPNDDNNQSTSTNKDAGNTASKDEDPYADRKIGNKWKPGEQPMFDWLVHNYEPVGSEIQQKKKVEDPEEEDYDADADNGNSSDSNENKNDDNKDESSDGSDPGNHPRTAAGWKPFIEKAAKAMKVDVTSDQVNKIIAVINGESGGQEDVVAPYSGSPTGLLQYKQSTFDKYSVKGHNNIKNGWDQLLALFNDSNWERDMTTGGWGPTGEKRKDQMGAANEGVDLTGSVRMSQMGAPDGDDKDNSSDSSSQKDVSSIADNASKCVGYFKNGYSFSGHSVTAMTGGKSELNSVDDLSKTGSADCTAFTWAMAKVSGADVPSTVWNTSSMADYAQKGQYLKKVDKDSAKKGTLVAAGGTGAAGHSVILAEDWHGDDTKTYSMGDDRGVVEVPFKQSMGRFNINEVTFAVPANMGAGSSDSSDNKDDKSDEGGTDKDFWKDRNPADTSQKSAYKGTAGNSQSGAVAPVTQIDNSAMYKDLDGVYEYAANTNNYSKSSADVDNRKRTKDGQMLTASDSFLKLWQTVFENANNGSQIGSMDNFVALTNVANAINGYTRDQVNMRTTGTDDKIAGNVDTNFKPGLAGKNALIDEISMPEKMREGENGQSNKGYSYAARQMIAKFDLAAPTSDYFGLSDDNGLFNMYVPKTRQDDSDKNVMIFNINKNTLNNYIQNLATVRASINPSESTDSASSNTNAVDPFTMAEAQLMALQLWFNMNKTTGYSGAFPTGFETNGFSQDALNRILYVPIAEIGKSVDDNSQYNNGEINKESPIRLQDNVSEFFVLRASIFGDIGFMLAQWAEAIYNWMISFAVKYLYFLVLILALIHFWKARKPGENASHNLRMLANGTLSFLLIFGIIKFIHNWIIIVLAERMNNGYVMNSYYKLPMEFHAWIEFFMDSIIIWWILRKYLPYLKNNWQTLGGQETLGQTIQQQFAGATPIQPSKGLMRRATKKAAKMSLGALLAGPKGVSKLVKKVSKKNAQHKNAVQNVNVGSDSASKLNFSRLLSKLRSNKSATLSGYYDDPEVQKVYDIQAAKVDGIKPTNSGGLRDGNNSITGKTGYIAVPMSEGAAKQMGLERNLSGQAFIRANSVQAASPAGRKEVLENARQAIANRMEEVHNHGHVHYESFAGVPITKNIDGSLNIPIGGRNGINDETYRDLMNSALARNFQVTSAPIKTADGSYAQGNIQIMPSKNLNISQLQNYLNKGSKVGAGTNYLSVKNPGLNASQMKQAQTLGMKIAADGSLLAEKGNQDQLNFAKEIVQKQNKALQSAKEDLNQAMIALNNTILNAKQEDFKPDGGMLTNFRSDNMKSQQAAQALKNLSEQPGFSMKALRAQNDLDNALIEKAGSPQKLAKKMQDQISNDKSIPESKRIKANADFDEFFKQNPEDINFDQQSQNVKHQTKRNFGKLTKKLDDLKVLNKAQAEVTNKIGMGHSPEMQEINSLRQTVNNSSRSARQMFQNSTIGSIGRNASYTAGATIRFNRDTNVVSIVRKEESDFNKNADKGLQTFLNN